MCGAMAVYVLLFCLSHLAADTMTVGSWECTIIKLGDDAAYHDILASAGLELTLLLSSALCISDFLGSGEGICVAEMYVYMKYIHVERVVLAFAFSALRIFRILAPFQGP